MLSRDLDGATILHVRSFFSSLSSLSFFQGRKGRAAARTTAMTQFPINAQQNSGGQKPLEFRPR